MTSKKTISSTKKKWSVIINFSTSKVPEATIPGRHLHPRSCTNDDNSHRHIHVWAGMCYAHDHVNDHKISYAIYRHDYNLLIGICINHNVFDT